MKEINHDPEQRERNREDYVVNVPLCLRYKRGSQDIQGRRSPETPYPSPCPSPHWGED